jgi:glycosyltransferase involved in cell wall biosynthesis
MARAGEASSLTLPEGLPQRTQLAFLCSPYHRGGIERWMADMAIEWQHRWGSSWFVTPRPRRPFINGADRPTVADILLAEPTSDQPKLGLPEVGSEYEFGTEAFRASVYTRATLATVPAGVPLIVSDDPSAWRAAAGLSTRNPFIAVIHGEWPGYDALITRYRNRIQAFVGVSRRVSRRVRALLPAVQAPVATIPCGIRVHDAPRRSAVRSGPVRLAWVGRMREEAKRVSDLPRIAAVLRDRGVPFTLEIMGDGEERLLVAAAVEELGLSALTTLLPWGTPSDVRALLARSDVMLLPSNREGMPIAVMEALTLGCAVVATRISGIEDYEDHPHAAGCLWVYAVGDVEAAADAVVQAAALDPEDRARRAFHLGATEFSAARAADRYADLLTRLSIPAGEFEGSAWRDRLSRLLSYPVAAQRIVRVWSTGRFRRPRPVAVDPYHIARA